MTDTDIRPTPDQQFWTRRLRLSVWACIALVFLLFAVLAVWARMQSLDEDYGPIGHGSFGGPGASAGVESDDGDGYGHTRLVTTGNHTAYVFSSMRNDGSHSVVVTGIDLDDITVGAQWAPYPDDLSRTGVFAPGTHWRDFPATIRANTQAQLRFTIRRPTRCQDKPMRRDGGEFYTDDHDVHWESLFDAHTTTVSSGSFGDDDVQVC